MSKRLLVARISDKAGTTEALLQLRRKTGSHYLPVLTFHRVADVGPDYAFDEGVIGSTASEFSHQMEQLRRYFQPIGLDDLMAFMRGHALPRNPVLVTFDDGYRDNRRVALPILQRHGIEALFFVTTDYVTRRRVFWWDRISYIVKRSQRPRVVLEYPERIELQLSTREGKLRGRGILLRLVKSRLGLELERFLVDLAAAAGVEWDDDLERRSADELLMTWDDVRELRAAGMSVQSHTRTHRVLQTLTSDRLAHELLGSRVELERELDEPIHAISYPVGHTLAGRVDVRDALRAAGYKLGFTNATGAQSLPSIDPFDVRRICIGVHTPPALFRAMLAAPSLF